jgi:peptidoglycan/xylan/chitin deacetylase (PgdA/CDA1 family)
MAWCAVEGMISYWQIAWLLLAYSLVLFYGSYFIQSNFFLKAICSAKTNKKEIAISFDDGPVENMTPSVLEILKQHHVQAAFFCIGKNVAAHAALLQQIHDEGHLIGNHSFTHNAWFDLFSQKRMQEELLMTDEAIKKVTGLRPKLFRPPYGVTNPTVKKVVAKGKYTAIGWSVRSYDTVIQDEQKLLRRVTRNIRPGDIFLFHDKCISTVHILPTFLQLVKQKGFSIARLDKLLDIEAYE